MKNSLKERFELMAQKARENRLPVAAPCKWLSKQYLIPVGFVPSHQELRYASLEASFKRRIINRGFVIALPVNIEKLLTREGLP
jgi:hypothetical protein